MNNKICFITAVNDELLYEECKLYINNLHVPENYEIEFISIRNATSICSAYNTAMKKSNAKYKVYLHQDVYITNKDFINNIISLFNSDKNIGMIGLCGAKEIPKNAVWWESKQCFGSVLELRNGAKRILSFKDVPKKYEKVKSIDGFLIVTQYDVAWKDDIFDGWHFYDISQCMEFTNKQYSIIIPRQIKPWCIHDCGVVSVDGYDKYREIFINTYKL